MADKPIKIVGYFGPKQPTFAPHSSLRFPSVIPGLTRNPELIGTNTKYNMKEERNYYVYILASKRNGTLYIGVTNNLLNRSFQHKTKENKNSFTAKYNVNRLVYCEVFSEISTAIAREKQLKNWRREWKIKLIEEENPTWRDLFNDFQFIRFTPGS